MEKNESVAKARHDLEKLYTGIPDDSVDLTFRYLAKTDQQNEITSPVRNTRGVEPMKNSKQRESQSTDPSTSPPGNRGRVQGLQEIGMASFPLEGREQRELKGIVHSNNCALCSSNIRLFRHRCLVCGKAYCNKCVEMGMGAMTEGRKCIECLGRRFSQRYIKRAGKSGFCFGYRSEVKQQELIWAEKGPPKGCVGNYRSPNFIVTRSPGFSSSPNRFTLQGK